MILERGGIALPAFYGALLLGASGWGSEIISDPEKISQLQAEKAVGRVILLMPRTIDNLIQPLEHLYPALTRA